MKKIIALLLLIIIVTFVVNTLHHAGAFKDIEAHSKLSNISIYTTMAGTEDLEIDRESGLLFISSSDRWKQAAGIDSDDGVYLLDLNSKADPYKLPTSYEGEFHPHGMSFLSKNGDDYLFVINHNQKGNFVELFKYEDYALFHLRTFESQQMCCPNDLVAVDLDKFYLTNDHGTSDGLMRTVEDYLRIPNSYVLYFDGENYTKVYEDLNYANGINISADGEMVYVAETSGRKLSVLDRDIASGNLNLRFTKELETGLDNITIDGDGNLWVASHPKLLDFVGHAKNTGDISPSQVLKLSPTLDSDFEVTEVYLNEGEQISGSSTALYYNGEVFIGVVFENKLLRGSYQNMITALNEREQ